MAHPQLIDVSVEDKQNNIPTQTGAHPPPPKRSLDRPPPEVGMELVLSRLSSFGLPIIAADADRAVRSSLIKLRLIKLKRDIPYVDAFGIELASDSREHVFVTADFDFKPASRDVTIEFLPAK